MMERSSNHCHLLTVILKQETKKSLGPEKKEKEKRGRRGQGEQREKKEGVKESKKGERDEERKEESEQKRIIKSMHSQSKSVLTKSLPSRTGYY